MEEHENRSRAYYAIRNICDHLNLGMYWIISIPIIAGIVIITAVAWLINLVFRA